MTRAFAFAVLAACGTPSAPVEAPAHRVPVGSGTTVAAPPIDAPAPSEEEKLAAIQKAMNELSPAVQQCWAAVAVERYDIDGELSAQIEIGPPTKVAVVRDTTKSPKLAACVTALLEQYPWAPPLRGQAIQLPFKWSAPDGQSVIDRRLVPWQGQAGTSVAVLLDENNTNNASATMFELAIQNGATTGMRGGDRPELWLFLGDATVSSIALKPTAVHRDDMMYVPAGGAREVKATSGDVHAVIVVVPGGREGAARAGALPTREITSWRAAPAAPVIIPLAKSHQFCAGNETGSTSDGIPVSGGASPKVPCGVAGYHDIYVEPSTLPAAVLSASRAGIGAGVAIPEHVHAKETELLYILDGEGTMKIAGLDVAVGPTSVVQIPPNTKHAFTATKTVQALQIYTPAGPEQRFKVKK